MAASTIPLILLCEVLVSWEMEFITSYFVAPLMDMLNYTASGVKERRMRMFTYSFPLLGFGNKPPPPLPETQWILAILQSWELAEYLATESFPVVPLCNEYSDFWWPLVVPCQGSFCGLPMALVLVTPFGDFQHGKYFLRAAQARASLAFYFLE